MPRPVSKAGLRTFARPYLLTTQTQLLGQIQAVTGTIERKLRWQFYLKTSNHLAEGTYEISMVSGDASESVIDPTCTWISLGIEVLRELQPVSAWGSVGLVGSIMRDQREGSHS